MAIDDLQQVRDVVAQAERRIMAALSSDSDDTAADAATDAAQRADVSRIFAAFNLADATANAGARAIMSTLGDTRFTLQERQSSANATLATVRADVDGELAQAVAISEAVVKSLRAATLIARPNSADAAAQEAALGNVRADLRMALDPIKGAMDVVNRLAELIDRYMASDPAGLAAWLLTSTEWPQLYLESRGFDPAFVLAFEARVPDAVAPAQPDEQREARAALAVIEGPRGLNAALLSARYLVTRRLDEVAALIARAA